jgi:hypothetical protein
MVPHWAADSAGGLRFRRAREKEFPTEREKIRVELEVVDLVFTPGWSMKSGGMRLAFGLAMHQ